MRTLGLTTLGLIVFWALASIIFIKSCTVVAQDLTYQDSLKSYNKRIAYYSKHNKKLMHRQVELRDKLILKHK